MANDVSISDFSCVHLLDSDNLLTALAKLFSKNYGIWGAKGPRPGQQVSMSTDVMKRLLLFDTEACGALVASMGDPLNVIGHAFYYKFSTPKLGNVCWITQLVVCQKLRHKGIASRLIKAALSISNFHVCGLVTSHPFAIRALERATSCLCTQTLIEKYSKELIENCHLPYINPKSEIDNNLSINTQFFVDHTEVLEIIQKETEQSRWIFGKLLEGHEFFCFVFLNSEMDDCQQPT